MRRRSTALASTRRHGRQARKVTKSHAVTRVAWRPRSRASSRSRVTASACAGAGHQRRRRTYVRRWPPTRFEGRLAGSDGRTAGRRLHRRASCRRIGAKPLPGQRGLPIAVRVHRRHEGRRLDDRCTADDGAFDVRRTTCRRCPSPTTARSPARSSSPATASSCPKRRTSATTATPTLDVKDKVVVVLRYFPEDADRRPAAILARYADLRYKAMAARQRGAKALLVVTGPRSPNAGEARADDVRHGARRLRHRRGQRQRRGRRRRSSRRAGKPLATTQKELDSGNPHVAGFAMPGVTRHGARRASCARSRPAATSSATCRRPRRRTRAEAVGRGRRALRSSRPRRARQFARRRRKTPARFTTAPTTTRRARRPSSPLRRNASPASRASATSLLAFWSGEELGLIGSTRLRRRSRRFRSTRSPRT